MRTVTWLTLAVLALVAITAVHATSNAHGDDGSESPATLNALGLEASQATTVADLDRARLLFSHAFLGQRSVLRATRRRLRAQLDQEYEDDLDAFEETTEARALRDEIRSCKQLMADYRTNQAVANMRMSRLYAAQRLLGQALELVPGFANAEDNLGQVKRLLKQGSAVDEPDEQLRRRKSSRRRSSRKNKAQEEDEAEEESVYERPAKRQPQPEPEVPQISKRKKRPSALDRTRRPNTNVRRPLPRVHIAHLGLAENKDYADGRAPFILLGALDKWQFSEHWSTSSFSRLYSSATVDFYPHNMEKLTVRPYLTPLPRALEEQTSPTTAYPESPTHPGSYIQWNVNWRDWKAMTLNMLPSGLPAIFRQDDPWLMETSTECFDSHELQDEFTLRTHWRMVLIGNRGAGMFNHQDVLRTSSYQAQVAGSKRWHICAPSQSHWIGRAGGVDAFDPDYAQYPNFARADCFEDVVESGEMVFYPADYWHQTENVHTPTIAVTGTIMDRHNHALIIEELSQECTRKKYGWGFSPHLCEALQNKCFAFWRKLYAAPVEHKEDL